MADPQGFLKFKRKKTEYRPVCERVKDFNDVAVLRKDDLSIEQSARCMDCGTPFCHWGCPVGNLIPEWNDAVFHKQWEKAIELLHSTNNLPEITGRICPAPCEYSCVLAINDDPVTIRENELDIIEHAFQSGWVKPVIPQKRTGKKVAVIGSGPAGLSCAAQLNQAGHQVTVFERDNKAGGILRYGIPDFKLEKWILDRRIDIYKAEGIEFLTGVSVGKDYPSQKLLSEYDAVCLAGGSRTPRDIKIEGRELKGIHFAMDYLMQNNHRLEGDVIPAEAAIDAKDKKVVVIGGGDTGSDCVGTAHRQGAACVVQIELMPKPADSRTEAYPWPKYPMILKTSTSHEEGGDRDWSISTKRFIGSNGKVEKLVCSKLDFSQKDEKGAPIMKEVPDSEFEIDADMVVLALGFLHPEHEGPLSDLKLELDPRGNVKTSHEYQTSVPKVYSAGDMRRGQSLIVWAISEGRRAAHFIDKNLMGETTLPLI